MKIFAYFTTIILLFQIINTSNDFMFSTLDNPLEDFIKSSIQDALNITQKNLSNICFDSLNFLVNDKDYLNKVIRDSGRFKDDLGNIEECLSIDFNSTIKNDTMYYLLKINETSPYNHSYLKFDFTKGYFLGVCIFKGCNNSEFKNFFYNLNSQLNITKIEWEEIDPINNIENQSKSSFIISIFFILILFVMLLFTLFPSFPSFIFKRCFSINNHRPNSKRGTLKEAVLNFEEEIKSKNPIIALTESSKKTLNNDEEDYDIERLNQFQMCFSFGENSENSLVLKTSFLNDSGLHFIKGVKVISLIFFLVSYVYLILMNSPLKKYCQVTHFQLLSSSAFFLIFLGNRISPRILFAISGFILSYKLYNYLEQRVDNSHFSFSEFRKKKIITGSNSSLKLTDSQKEQTKNLIHISLYFKFVFPQVYKYLLYVLTFLFLRYSFCYIISLFITTSPMWVWMYNNIINSLSTSEIFLKILLIDILYHKQFSEEINQTMIWIVENECVFFIIGSALLFIFYKKRWRIDIFLLISIILLFLLKLIVCCFINKSDIYPMEIISTQKYGYMLDCAYFNLIYYFIGLYFGLINYVIQKSITYEFICSHKKFELNLPFKFVNFFRTKSSYTHYFILLLCVIYFIFDSFSYLIFDMIVKTKNDDYRYLENNYLFLFYIIDVDIFVLLIFVFFTGLLLIGNNFIVNFFSNNLWLFLSRSYFSFLITCNFVVLYVLYQSETRLNLEMSNIIFYSFYIIFIQIVITSILFICIELPMKRLNKFFIKEDKEDDDREFDEIK